MEHAYPQDGGPTMPAEQVDDTIKNPILENTEFRALVKQRRLFREHDGAYARRLFWFYSFPGLYTCPFGYAYHRRAADDVGRANRFWNARFHDSPRCCLCLAH